LSSVTRARWRSSSRPSRIEFPATVIHTFTPETFALDRTLLGDAVELAGYPIELSLAEMIATA
jgi:hypothetical protein